MVSINCIRVLTLVVAFVEMIAATPTLHVAEDGNSYLIENDHKCNWLEANDFCARQDLQLVVIDNADKNSALYSLLKKNFVRTPNVWIGHHDEFNKHENQSRSFYSLSTGDKINFSNWRINEPNNVNSQEHCVHFDMNTDFQWNDNNCEKIIMGYICEKHHLTQKYIQDLEQKRQSTYKMNNQLETELANTQDDIKQVMSSSQSDIDVTLLQLKESTHEILLNSKESIKDILMKKPYLEAVIADVGDAIREILLEAHSEISNLTEEARLLIEETHLEAAIAVDDVITLYGNKLSENTKDIDQLLVL